MLMDFRLVKLNSWWYVWNFTPTIPPLQLVVSLEFIQIYATRVRKFFHPDLFSHFYATKCENFISLTRAQVDQHPTLLNVTLSPAKVRYHPAYF